MQRASRLERLVSSVRTPRGVTTARAWSALALARNNVAEVILRASVHGLQLHPPPPLA